MKTILKIVILCVICAAMAGCIESMTKSEYPISVTIEFDQSHLSRSTPTVTHTYILRQDGSIISPAFGDMYTESGTWTYTGEANGAKLYTWHLTNDDWYFALYKNGRATLTEPGGTSAFGGRSFPDRVSKGTWKRGL